MTDDNARTNRKTVGVALLVVAVVVVGALLMLNRSTPAPQPLRTVVISQAAKTLLYLPLYVAIDSGFMAGEGIQATVTTAGGDAQAFAALASGQSQFAQGDPTFVAVSNERGGPGIVVASVLDRVAFWGVSFNKNLRPIVDPSGFRGLTVVTFPQPNTAYVIQKDLVSRAGLHLGSDTRILQAAFGTELAPLQAGKAQVAVSIEPTVSQAIAQGAHIVFSYPNAWGPFLLTGLMTTQEFAHQQPEVVRGVVRAYERALRLIHDNPEAAVSVGERNFPEVPADVIRAAVARLVEEKVFPEHASVDLTSWRAALQVRVEVGDLRTAAHDSLVDNTYAMAASSRQ